MPDTLAPPRASMSASLAAEYAFEAERASLEAARRVHQLLLLPLTPKQVAELSKVRDELVMAAGTLTRKLNERAA